MEITPTPWCEPTNQMNSQKSADQSEGQQLPSLWHTHVTEHTYVLVKSTSFRHGAGSDGMSKCFSCWCSHICTDDSFLHSCETSGDWTPSPRTPSPWQQLHFLPFVRDKQKQSCRSDWVGFMMEISPGMHQYRFMRQCLQDSSGVVSVLLCDDETSAAVGR